MSYMIPMGNTGMLSQQGMGLPTNTGTPVLANPMQPTAPAPALQGATGNRRMSARMPQMPNNRIPMGSEGLMRIGGAGLAANNQGALATLGAMANQYGAIQDYNRAADMEAYQQEVLRANEEEARRQLALKMQQDAAAKDAKDKKDPADVSREIVNMQSALEALKDKQLTGAWDANYVKQWLDRSGIKIPFLEYGADVEKAANRLLLQELAVFATLEFTSKTKGAISDREMALFRKPIPKITDDEQLWIDWITPRLEILLQVQQNGVSNEKAAEGGSSGGSNSTDSSIDDLLNQYAPNT